MCYFTTVAQWVLFRVSPKGLVEVTLDPWMIIYRVSSSDSFQGLPQDTHPCTHSHMYTYLDGSLLIDILFAYSLIRLLFHSRVGSNAPLTIRGYYLLTQHLSSIQGLRVQGSMRVLVWV
jgi:hypothetical protein